MKTHSSELFLVNQKFNLEAARAFEETEAGWRASPFSKGFQDALITEYWRWEELPLCCPVKQLEIGWLFCL